MAATWRSDPGPALVANYTVTNAIANSGPQPLGRNLSSGNITVNLIRRARSMGIADQQPRFPCSEDLPTRPDCARRSGSTSSTS